MLAGRARLIARALALGARAPGGAPALLRRALMPRRSPAAPRRWLSSGADASSRAEAAGDAGVVVNTLTLSAGEVERILVEEKGRDLFVLDMQGVHGGKLGDTMVVVTGTNRRHMLHLAETVREAARAALDADAADDAVPAIEDEDSQDWMLLDLGSVVVHFFSEKGRAYYDIESFWKDNVRRHLAGDGVGSVGSGAAEDDADDTAPTRRARR